jgi:hypothetical protein
VCSTCDGTEKFLVREGFNGAYFMDNNFIDLGEKITNLLKDEQRLVKMGENSVKIIEHEVNIKTVVDKYIEAINYVKKYDN